jgi:hypothetical protein
LKRFTFLTPKRHVRRTPPHCIGVLIDRKPGWNELVHFQHQVEHVVFGRDRPSPGDQVIPAPGRVLAVQFTDNCAEFALGLP